MKKILLIEDDKELGKSLSQFLVKEGFSVNWTESLEKSRALLKEYIPQLILLDWMLPDGQGIDFLRDLKNAKVELPEGDSSTIPVIMLTARNELLDKILGLESGADDYLTKPFEPRELMARIRVQLRKNSPGADQGKDKESEEKKIIRGDLLVDTFSREVFFKSEIVHLTKLEYDLLLLLLENPGRPFTRDELLNKVWGFEFTPTTRTVDTHVLQLRHKFGEELIETVRGVGYRLNKKY